MHAENVHLRYSESVTEGWVIWKYIFSRFVLESGYHENMMGFVMFSIYSNFVEWLYPREKMLAASVNLEWNIPHAMC